MEKEHQEEATQELNVVVEGEEPNVEETPQEEVAESTEEQAQVEEPVQEQVAEDPLKQELAQIKEESDRIKRELDELKYKQDVPAYEPPPAAVDDDIPDFGDVYTDPEGYNRRLAEWVKSQKDAAAKEATENFVNSDRFKALETSHWEGEYQRNVDRAKQNYGERFDFEGQAEKIMEIQKRYPGTSVADAHKILDYDKLLEENNRMKDGKRERANTQEPESGGATRMVQKVDNEMTTVKLSASEKAVALKFWGHLGEKEALKKYANGKQRQQDK